MDGPAGPSRSLLFWILAHKDWEEMNAAYNTVRVHNTKCILKIFSCTAVIKAYAWQMSGTPAICWSCKAAHMEKIHVLVLLRGKCQVCVVDHDNTTHPVWLRGIFGVTFHHDISVGMGFIVSEARRLS
jgi:hypothetical protein